MAAESAPPPEAQLIAARRLQANLTVREAARRAGISDGTWRRIESAAAGITRPPDKVARAAAVLAISPAELSQAGRPDAAGALGQLTARTAAEPDVAEIVGAPDGDGDAAWPALMAEILAGLTAIDGESGLTAADRRQLRAEFLGGLRHDAAQWRRRLAAMRRITGQR